MFDFKKTFDLIQGGLLEPKATWQSYLSENRGWQDTAVLLTLPLIIASFVLAGALSWVFGSYYMYTLGGGFGAWLLGLIMAAIGISVASLIFSYLAGVFKGKHDFNKGLAALSLAAIPGYIGNVLGSIPFIGWIISVALGIVTLVFLYQIIPSYLEVPDDKRVLHYVVSLVATFVVMLILSTILGMGGMASMPRDVSMSDQAPGQAGMFGGIQRYAQMMERAEQDRYDPPADGKITEAQMGDFMEVMRKTAEVRDERIARIEKLKEKYEDQDSETTDLRAASEGIGSMLGAYNSEMEVVMTGSGNWAEHQWIKQQLLTARIQKDISEAVKHNYTLYQMHQEELEQLSAAL